MIQTIQQWIQWVLEAGWVTQASLFFLLMYIGWGVDYISGGLKIGYLKNVKPLDLTTKNTIDALPKISVIVPACNEEEGITDCLTSLLNQTYPHLEIVAINDRSTDSTGALMDKLATTNEQLKIIHVTELPTNELWLGKNHALHLGSQQSTGEWIIFTDGDIVFEPQAVELAMSYCLEKELDHLAMTPDLVCPSFLFECFFNFFTIVFSASFRQWEASNPKSKRYVGVGAFNMVKRPVYLATGGHDRLKNNVIDDMELGRIIKEQGNKQDVLLATKHLSVEWYDSTMAMLKGLEKNAFAGGNYKIIETVIGLFLLGFIVLSPYILLILSEPASIAFWSNLATIGVIILVSALSTAGTGINPLVGVGYPLGMLLMFTAIARSAFVVLRDGGVTWRGTFYPLSELLSKK